MGLAAEEVRHRLDDIVKRLPQDLPRIEDIKAAHAALVGNLSSERLLLFVATLNSLLSWRYLPSTVANAVVNSVTVSSGHCPIGRRFLASRETFSKGHKEDLMTRYAELSVL